MPQLQALQAIPSLGEELGRALGIGTEQGLSNALQGYQERKKAQSQISALEGFLGEKLPQGFSQLPEKIQSTLVQDKLFNKLFSGQASQSSEQMQGEQQSPAIQGQPQQNKGGFSGLSDDALIRATANPIYKDAAKAELDRRNSLQKDIRKSDIKRSDKYLDQINDSRIATQRARSSLQSAEQALGNRDLGFFSRDNLANVLGIPGLASPEGAVFNAAAKNFFLADLQSAVGRPNQFLEKILQNAIFANGKSNEANEALLDFYKNQVDLEEEKIKISDNLEDYYRSKGLSVPGNIGRLVDQQLKPFALEKEKQLLEKYKDSQLAKSQEKGKTIRMIDPNGVIRDVPKNQVSDAQRAGYKAQK